jgi:hypothetical protein
MEYTLGKNTTKNLESILESGKESSKILVNAVKDFIHDTPIDFCIIGNGGYRTTEVQHELFLAGNSKCDGIKNLSEHQKGLAVDLVPWISNKSSWDRDSCLYLAGAFMAYCNRMNIPITGGADWNGDGNLKEAFFDPCHFQIKEL